MTKTIDALVEALNGLEVAKGWLQVSDRNYAVGYLAKYIASAEAALAQARAEQAELPDSSQKRMLHDFSLLQAFHTKHALGPMLAPSCLSCGQQTDEATRPVSVRHMELPGIVVCKVCHDAARAEQAEPVAWLVCSVNKDGSLSLEHAAAWQEAAHAHINDAITEHDIQDAAKWVVRPAYTTPPAAPVAKLEPVAWMTNDDEGSPAMLFFDKQEAENFCGEEEQPTPLYAAHNAKLGNK